MRQLLLTSQPIGLMYLNNVQQATYSHLQRLSLPVGSVFTFFPHICDGRARYHLDFQACCPSQKLTDSQYYFLTYGSFKPYLGTQVWNKEDQE